MHRTGDLSVGSADHAPTQRCSQHTRLHRRRPDPWLKTISTGIRYSRYLTWDATSSNASKYGGTRMADFPLMGKRLTAGWLPCQGDGSLQSHVPSHRSGL